MFNDVFLNEEIRNDYKISREQKALWQTQISIMDEIDRICKKHKIKYFAEGGTLLGAVRHQGFIPWDDDIDLSMTRNDYLKFREVVKFDLDEQFFFQDNTTEKNFFRVHGQVRKNNTTMLIKYDYMRNYHRGVFVDIFIYDKVPTDKKLAKKFRNKLELYRKLLVYKQMVYETGIKKIIKNLIGFFGVSLYGGFNRLVKKFDNLSMKYNNLKNNYYYDLVSYYTNKRELNFPSDLFDEVITLPFEYTNTYSMPNYDLYLTTLFGTNYMTPIKAPTEHGQVFIDLNNAYTKYDNLSRQEYEDLFNGQEVKN